MSRLREKRFGGRDTLRHAAQEAVGAHGLPRDAQQQRRELRAPGGQAAHDAVQRPFLAAQAQALAAQRDPGGLALGPVVVDDLAVLGLEALAGLARSAAERARRWASCGAPSGVDEVAERRTPAAGTDASGAPVAERAPRTRS